MQFQNLNGLLRHAYLLSIVFPEFQSGWVRPWARLGHAGRGVSVAFFFERRKGLNGSDLENTDSTDRELFQRLFADASRFDANGWPMTPLEIPFRRSLVSGKCGD
jgi:hypothetical protein